MGEASAIGRGVRIASQRSVKRLAQRAAAHGVRELATHVHAFDKLPTGTTSQPVGERALLQQHRLIRFVVLGVQLSIALLHESITARPSSAMEDRRLPSPPQGVAAPYGH